MPVNIASFEGGYMHNRISKVEVVGDYSIRCSFYSGDVREYDVSVFEDCPKKDFDVVRIVNNGNCLKWDDKFELLAEEIWKDSIIVEKNYPEPRYQFAMLLSYYRELNKLTQKDMEEKTGISQSDISRYERGEANPSLDTLDRVANSIGRKVVVDFIALPEVKNIDPKEFEGAEEIIDYLPKWKKQGQFTIKDIEKLPDEYNIELIKGVIRLMGQPNMKHQLTAMYISGSIWNYIKKNKGKCKVMQAPALTFDNKNTSDTYLVPDVAVVCNKENINKNGIINKADFIIEIVSPGLKNKIHDYKTKLNIYLSAGVREYWIVDPEKKRVTSYTESDGYMPTIYGFDSVIPVGIYDGKLEIDMKDLDLEGIDD